MEVDYPPLMVSATPDDVLAILRDMHRQQCSYDFEADPTVSLSRESKVADWRWACDLVRTDRLARALNKYWNIEVPIETWRDVLEPQKERTLGGVCDLIAGAGAKAPRVRPVNLLGRACVPAGVFLTIRSELAAAGADVAEVAPSTPVAEYARRHFPVILGPVARLAPGALPVVKIRHPHYWACLHVLLVSIAVMVVAWCAGLTAVGVAAFWTALASYGALCFVALRVLPTSVGFEGIVTFRDLANTIAARVNGGVTNAIR